MAEGHHALQHQSTPLAGVHESAGRPLFWHDRRAARCRGRRGALQPLSRSPPPEDPEGNREARRPPQCEQRRLASYGFDTGPL
jgi:hypothetical protein